MLCIQKRSPEVICGKIRAETKYAKQGGQLHICPEKSGSSEQSIKWTQLPAFPPENKKPKLLFFDILNGELPGGEGVSVTVGN